MIIFDLDGTLADCEHRRKFVQEPDIWEINEGPLDPMSFNVNSDKWRKWKPDWKSFYEACDKDKSITAVIDVFIHITQGEPFNHDIRIWSGRCESVREKTLNWLVNLNGYCEFINYWDRRLKMRPIGDNTPDEFLKERWLDEVLSKGEKIEFVFDDCPRAVRMWRRRGIFVFNCSQNDRDF